VGSQSPRETTLHFGSGKFPMERIDGSELAGLADETPSAPLAGTVGRQDELGQSVYAPSK
jgi:hypothetical protein